jgi:hypothetical protein
MPCKNCEKGNKRLQKEKKRRFCDILIILQIACVIPLHVERAAVA